MSKSNNYPLLEHTYEEYCVMAQNGDKSAVDILCQYNRSFINKMCSAGFAYCNCPKEVDFQEMHQEGYIGFLEAIKTFVPDKNIKFLSYSGECVKNRVIDYLKKTVIEKRKKFPVQTKYYREDIYGPNIPYNPAESDRAKKFDRIIPNDYLPADEVYFIKYNSDITKAALAVLDKRHREYIDYRFGTGKINYDYDHTREETAEYFGISLSEAGKIENEAKSVMKEFLIPLYTFVKNDVDISKTAKQIKDKFSFDTKFIGIYFKLIHENNSSTKCRYSYVISRQYKEDISGAIDIDFEEKAYSVQQSDISDDADIKLAKTITAKISNSLITDYEEYGPLPNGILFMPENKQFVLTAAFKMI